ncbi:MAG: 4-alpha-glucanotransferase [Anaerolineae bacterium]|nr:4-alpha-glucanotransferase [Anaerolineae bacterium]
MTLLPRCSGVLLHPTSLPGRYGIGDLGDWAYRFADWLEQQGQTIWQVLPLTPTGYADSPYQSLSAFAGNANLISLDKLVEDKWLTADDLAGVPDFPADRVDYGPVIDYKEQKLALAFERFTASGTVPQRADFEVWCAANAGWLDDFVLFAALKRSYNLVPWTEWPEDEALRDPAALDAARGKHARAIQEQRFRQWVFARQWSEVKAYANDRGIRFVGDLPIFVAHDSADVWANRDDFYLDEKGYPTVIAGVPPDYFSPTGQRWGNPLYRWDRIKARRYKWWIARLQQMLSVVDYIRIDHFRGFSAYWEIPADEETAINGEWKPGPGADFFTVVREELGDLPIIAEDLGVITEDVESLRDRFDLPGMKVLQFAWSDPKNLFLPHNLTPNSVVYTGTHDNNTTVGWWLDETDDGTRHFLFDYLDREIHEINWTLARIGLMSPASAFVMPLQDVIGLGAAARMNTPGKESGNWAWRFTPEQLYQDNGNGRLGHLTWLYQRRPDQQEREYGDTAIRSE